MNVRENQQIQERFRERTVRAARYVLLTRMSPLKVPGSYTSGTHLISSFLPPTLTPLSCNLQSMKKSMEGRGNSLLLSPLQRQEARENWLLGLIQTRQDSLKSGARELS